MNITGIETRIDRLCAVVAQYVKRGAVCKVHTGDVFKVVDHITHDSTIDMKTDNCFCLIPRSTICFKGVRLAKYERDFRYIFNDGNHDFEMYQCVLHSLIKLGHLVKEEQ